LREIQDLELADLARMLTLNNAHASETSLLDVSGMSALRSLAFYSRGIDGGATAILIALDQNALYDNPNFNWFRQRYEQFIYIDRVIVAGKRAAVDSLECSMRICSPRRANLDTGAWFVKSISTRPTPSPMHFMPGWDLQP
jgi:hypothetical protein